MASCRQLQGDFSLTGRNYSLLPGNPWWAEIGKENWPENLERDIAPLWHEPYGDRQQEIVIIGKNLDQAAITNALNECLVSDQDMGSSQETWNEVCSSAGDPFAKEWDAAIAEVLHAGHSH